MPMIEGHNYLSLNIFKSLIFILHISIFLAREQETLIIRQKRVKSESDSYSKTPFIYDTTIKFNVDDIMWIKKQANEFISTKLYFSRKNNIQALEIFLEGVLDKFSTRFLNMKPENFIYIVKEALNIYNFLYDINIFIKESYTVEPFTDIQQELSHPFEITQPESHIISLLYMLKANRELLNSLIKYSINGEFTLYMENLKDQKEGEIIIGDVKKFIKQETPRSVFLEIGYLLHLIIKENCDLNIYQYIIFNSYGVSVSKPERIVDSDCIETPFSLGIGYPCIYIWPEHYIVINTNDVVKNNFVPYLNNLFGGNICRITPVPIFLKAPPYIIMDYKKNIGAIPSSMGFVMTEWEGEIYNSFLTTFIMHSVLSDDTKYKLTGFVTLEITDPKLSIDEPLTNIPVKYTPFFKYQGKWNKGFYKLFEFNRDNNEILVYKNKLIRVLTLFYQRCPID